MLFQFQLLYAFDKGKRYRSLDGFFHTGIYSAEGIMLQDQTTLDSPVIDRTHDTHVKGNGIQRDVALLKIIFIHFDQLRIHFIKCDVWSPDK